MSRKIRNNFKMNKLIVRLIGDSRSKNFSLRKLSNFPKLPRDFSKMNKGNEKLVCSGTYLIYGTSTNTFYSCNGALTA